MGRQSRSSDNIKARIKRFVLSRSAPATQAQIANSTFGSRGRVFCTRIPSGFNRGDRLADSRPIRIAPASDLQMTRPGPEHSVNGACFPRLVRRARGASSTVEVRTRCCPNSSRVFSVVCSLEGEKRCMDRGRFMNSRLEPAEILSALDQASGPTTKGAAAQRFIRNGSVLPPNISDSSEAWCARTSGGRSVPKHELPELCRRRCGCGRRR